MRVLLAGLCTVDLVHRVDALPEPGEKVQSRAVEVAAGGPATNAAVAVAALGGEATLLTGLGMHPLARLARSDLESYDVAVRDRTPHQAEPPATSAVAVRESDGERAVVSHNAAGRAVPESTAGDMLAAGGDLPDTVLLDGHHPRLALRVAAWARAHGVRVVLDAGSWKPVLDDLLPWVDVCACSARFGVPPGTATLQERGVPVVITTAGSDPVWYSVAGGPSGQVAVADVRARDTLAAGDVWHGALAFALAGYGVPVAIEFANAVAGQRVRHVGPRAWVEPIRAGRRG